MTDASPHCSSRLSAPVCRGGEPFLSPQAAGSRLVWIVDPPTETVIAYRPSGDARIYSGADEVSGEDVLPGVSFRPTDLFHLD